MYSFKKIHISTNVIRKTEGKGINPWNSAFPLHSTTVDLTCNANLSGHWKHMLHCMNVTCFVLCNTDEVKTTDWMLIM